MASSDGIGYLIPENAQPDDLNCLLVFYPDDPMYLQALLGSLTYLGTWTAWERDSAKRGRLAAAAWKDANDCTLESMGCLTELVNALTGMNQTLAAIQAAIENQQISFDAGDLLPALTGIQTAIENQELTCNCGAGEGEDMGTVNVYCGCGCSGSPGGSTGGTIPDGVPDTYDPPYIPPMTDGQPYEPEAIDDDTCAVTHYMLMQWRNLILGIANGEIDRGGLYAKMETMFWGTWQWAAGTVNAVMEALGLYDTAPGHATGVASEIDSRYQSLQCAILQGGTQDEIVRRIWAIIDQMALPFWLRKDMKRVASHVPFEVAYLYNQKASMAAQIPESYYARGCPDCGEEDIYPTAPDGYRWRVGSQTYYSSGGNVTYTQFGHIMDVSVPLSGGDRFVQLRYPNYNASGVYGIGVFMETRPDAMYIRSGGWYTNPVNIPASDDKVVVFANKGAPVIDWGDWVVHQSDKALAIDMGRVDYLSGGGLYRFVCLELVPE